MYPLVKKSGRTREYEVIDCQGSENAQVKIYSHDFKEVSIGNYVKNKFLVRDTELNELFILKTKNSQIFKGDILEIFFMNGEYQINKINNQ
ncbi:hypothetical protein [Methanococcus voltae]|uniref:hypothetical protein n=1 Tax=Methanococcus voltae TaxID=2188 RepID=UPI001AE6FA7A|nr:hypothetical protein [Methanococcus voltae]MBP2173313.1 hypothetical protein [Methanococcus voltae]